jgi:hypothetical protein
MPEFTMRKPAIALAVFLAVLLVTGLTAWAENLELIDGTVVRCAIQEVRDSVVIVDAKPGNLRLTIPRKYLSLFQDYRLKVWRLKEDDLDPKDPNVQFKYGQWCLDRYDYDERLLEKAKEHLDLARKLDPSRADDIRLLIETHGFNENPKDLSKPWVSEEEKNILEGKVKDAETGKWHTKKQMEEIKKERERNIKIRFLAGTKPGSFAFATPAIILGDLAGYNEKRVRVWGRIVDVKKVFHPTTAGGVKFAPPKYLRVLLEGCPSVYFNISRSNLGKKLPHFVPGDRVVVYGIVRIGATWFAIDGVDIVVK